jgi:recombination protein RecA
VGGWPRGRIVEIFGPSSVGKTGLVLQSVAHAQRAGNTAVWIDADRSFDPGYAATLGVNVDSLPVVQPESAEAAIQMMLHLAGSGAVDLMAIDSAAALATELELAAGLGESAPDLHSRVLASGLPGLASAARRSGTTAVFLNQVRSRRDATGREIETSAGGAPLKLHAAVRIALAASGRRVRFRVLKNRAAGGLREGELLWKPGHGFTEGL